MEYLFEKSYQKISRVSLNFKRYLFEEIRWNNRLIGIKGARGAGKTTLLLQYVKQEFPIDEQVLYVSLDDLYFTENSLIDLAYAFVNQGGKILFLDEVHRYHNWSSEIKNIYDDHPDLRIIFTGSSMMHLNKAKGDLSRRAVMYELTGLSFREYVNFTQGLNLKPFSLEEILQSHTTIALQITQQLKPLAYFSRYLEHGFYPYFMEDPILYPQRLSETISLALDIDLPASHDISYASIEKIRLLLHIIAVSVPFKPNITKLSERIGISRNSLVQYLRYLEDLRIIKGLFTAVAGIGLLQKPEKIYLHHPNIQYALAQGKSNYGNARESFFINQISYLGKPQYTEIGDLIFNNYTFEIGGKNKTNKQIKQQENAYVVADEIEIGHAHKIPLWLFGFLY